ncbi:MAG: FecR domain-containing protein [Myxococcota bacterium]|nr:FecR domain-containing protein [Myxococcota bacterium]
MSAERCARAWEAEAVEDGQLTGAERISFERHAASCSDCAREIVALASLRRLMLEVAPPAPTPLELRRTRSSLLQKARSRSTRSSVAAGRVWAVAGVAVALLAMLGAAGRFWPSRAPVLPSTHVASSDVPVFFDVTSVADAVVTSRTEGPVTRATLGKGMAAFHVEHVGQGRRFLVMLPDGEIEVRGTRFVVDVQGGHTRSVEVSEGVVLLRLRDDAERRLEAGEGWKESPPDERPATSAPAPEVRVARGAVTPAAVVRRTQALAAISSSANEGAGQPAFSAQAVGTDAHQVSSQRFAAAVVTFRAGEYAQADRMLAGFVRDFSSDARCEDASFLRAVARSRLGDAKSAASLARDYLRDFPNGFRRREAERLAQSARAPQ